MYVFIACHKSFTLTSRYVSADCLTKKAGFENLLLARNIYTAFFY